MAELHDELTALLETWQGYWREKNFAGLRSLWDADEPEPLYIAEEAAEPMESYEVIQAYWDESAKVMDRILVRTWGLRAREVAPGIALVFFKLHWDAAIGPRPPIGGDVRVSAVLRRKPEGWRFFHYLEGPLAMLTQVRRYAEEQVTPGF
ncbi:MAG: nuclear transport factor 2 family protein [Dehalococcoidia bacterium]